MEEINLRDLFSFFWRKLPIVLFATSIIFALGIGYTTFLKTPLYSGNTTLILVKSNNGYEQGSSTQTQNDILLNQKLVSTYSEIIKSRRVLNQVVDELKLEYSSNELSNNITVSSISDTEIIKISVSDESNKKAAQIANTIANVFKEEIMEIYNLENVSIIDKAEVQDNPYNIQIMKEAIIYFAIGLVISSGVMFVIYYFDTSVKSSEEIESKLGIPVIGNVPKY